MESTHSLSRSDSYYMKLQSVNGRDGNRTVVYALHCLTTEPVRNLPFFLEGSSFFSFRSRETEFSNCVLYKVSGSQSRQAIE